MSESVHSAVDTLGTAIGTRDADLLQKIYADDITVWHGATDGAMGKAENIAMLSALFKITSSLEYINIKRYDIEDGVVQQHRLVGKFDDGTDMPGLNACLVIKVKDDQIISVEEYFDAQTYADVWPRIAAVQP
jgi:limonene-1,2-epoxide hydrolase